MDGQASANASRPVETGRVDLIGIAAAIATISIVGIGLSQTGPLFSLIMERQGLPDSVIGLSMATVGIAALAITPVMPRLAQRIGVARLMITTILITTLSFGLTYLMQNLFGWFLLRFVFGASLTGVFIISEYWINALAPEHRRGFIMGVYATFLSIGFASGPAILSVTGSVGPAPFVVVVILFLLSLFPVYLARRSAPDIAPDHKTSFWPFLFAVPLATGAVFIFGMSESASFAFLALYGTRLGLTEGLAVNLITMMALGGLIFLIPIGIIADRFDRRRVLLCCGIIGLIGALAFPTAARYPPALFAVIVVWGGIAAGLYTVGLTHLGSRFKGGDLASANAAFVFCYALGMLVGPMTVGAAMDVWDPHGFAWTVAFFYLLFTVLAVWRLSRPSETPRSA